MQSHSHSLGDRRAIHVALIAFACVVMGFLSGSSPTTRQIDTRVEQVEAPNQTAVPMICLGVRFAEDLHEELGESAELRDDEQDEDETKHYILRSDLAAFGSPTGPYESSADRAALTLFRLLASSTRGPPSA
jgi:hypothetical protein